MPGPRHPARASHQNRQASGRWLEVSVRSPVELVEPISTLLHRYGHGGVVIEQDGGFNPDEGEAPPPDAAATVRAYIPIDGGMRARREAIDAGLRLFSRVHPLAPARERELDEREWTEAWKDHFPLTRVGERIVIRPSWHEYRGEKGEAVVELEPGMAFGTGHHPTTRLCLEALEQRLRAGSRVLDLGTGSAILAIASARLGAARVVALDTDPVALRAARSNVGRNGLSRSIRLGEGTLPHPTAPPGRFHLALANISARATREHASHLAAALVPGGTLLASGFTREHAGEALQAAADAGLTVEETREQSEWLLVVARTRHHPGRSARRARL